MTNGGELRSIRNRIKTEDILNGKRNSLTDRDSGNGDSLDVGSCLLAFPPTMEAQRSATPCFRHFQLPHHGFQTQTMAFPISSDPQLPQHSPFLITTTSSTSPQEILEVVDSSGTPRTSTFV
ncbi:hypothetical protein ACTXT7_004855 [Hymenolepis weldensis]